MTFLNPLVLLGLAAAAIPVLIHLFNFRRPKRVDFSSLAFLRELEKTAMRRMRIRQWLLLVLRTLAIACLVLAFARPTWTTAWEGAFGARAPSSIVLVVDNSLSMTLRDAQGAYLDQAKALAAALAEATPSGDELAVLPTAALPDAPAPALGGPSLTLDRLATLETASGAEPTTAALARAGGLLEAATNPLREIFLFSDLQAATLADSGLTPLPEGTRVTLFPLGTRDQANTAIADVRVESRIVEAGQPVRVAATLVRYGNDAEGVAASLFVEGERVAQTATDLRAGRPTTVRFTFTPRRRGWLRGEVRLEPDAAEWDDRRFVALHVPEARRVLVVRGTSMRADYVTLALGLVAERGTLDVTEVDETQLGAAGIDAFDAVVLVGPVDLAEGERAALARYVQAGGGVLLFPSERPQTADYDALFLALGGGRLAGFVGAPGGPSLGGFAGADLEHPLFDGLFEGDARTLEEPEVSYAAQYAPGGGDETTLVRLAGGGPFLQEVRSGQGTLLFMAVAPDERWSDFPVRGLFVPLLFRAVTYLAADAPGADAALIVRQAGTLRVGNVAETMPLRLIGPGGDERIPAQRTVPGGVLLEVDETVTRPGVYDVMQGMRLLRRVAFNLDPRESDLTRLSADEARERLEEATGAEVRVLDATGGAGLAAAGQLRSERGGTELWNVFLALALGFLVAEMLVAMRWQPEPVSV
ncbi:MAG TPA: BatA domain-containing protein [Rubricoccaceae bacterium]|nr:BatA domain-containing protein [Rubricoccaceae bacterium]